MPVALPGPGEVELRPPDATEAQAAACAVASIVQGEGGLTPLQRTLIESLFAAMTSHHVDVGHCARATPHEAATVMARRELAFRTRMVQAMLLGALILHPIPVDIADRIAETARELGVDDAMVEVAREFANGSLGLAAIDFERNGYLSTWHESDTALLHSSGSWQSAWDVSVTDPSLAARWEALGDLPEGTLGRGVASLYEARGFTFPGTSGSAPPLLAQHDWVHVLADYGTTVESEIEVFGLIARANDDMHAFSLLAMVISLFETGYLRSGAGLFQSSPGHLSAHPTLAARLADAMRRGALCNDTMSGSSSIDFLRIDWFELADRPIEQVRSRFCLEPKSREAIAAGSVGPFAPGGISPFQLNAGRELAARLGRTYDPLGATP